jgi:tRNA (adenine57-N1/adenine58-N1)-methyltransferase
VKRFGFRNVAVREGNIYEPKNVPEKNFDVFVLDLPEPWNALGTAKKALRVGGFLAVYVPHIMQVQELVKSLGEDFLVEKVIEVIEREWVVDEMRTRPATKDHGHTGFLAFARRLC